jgi:hypothetical protein
LKKARDASFHLEIPGALDAVVVSGSEWSSLQKSGDEFKGNVFMKAGTAKVMAKFKKGNKYEVLLKYRVF